MKLFKKSHSHRPLTPLEELALAIKKKPIDLGDLEYKFHHIEVNSLDTFLQLWGLHEKAAKAIKHELSDAIKNTDKAHCPDITELAKAYMFHRICVQISANEFGDKTEAEKEDAITNIGNKIAHESILQNCGVDHAIHLNDTQRNYINYWIMETLGFEYEPDVACCPCFPC